MLLRLKTLVVNVSAIKIGYICIKISVAVLLPSYRISRKKIYNLTIRRAEQQNNSVQTQNASVTSFCEQASRAIYA